MGDALKVIESVINAYKVLPEVHAITLYGSRAKGTAAETSDINLMLIESKPPSQSTRAHVLSSLSAPDKPFLCRDIPVPMDALEIDGMRTSIWHIPEDLVCERVSSVLKNRRLEDSIIVAVLHESRILWDPKRQLQAWKNIISPVPLDYKKSVIPVLFSEIAYGLESMAGQVDSTPIFYIHHEQLVIIKAFYEIIYLANGSYFSLNPHLEQELERFESIPEGFSKNIENILNMDCSAKGLTARWRRLCHLAQIIGQFLELQGHYNLKAGWNLLKRTAPFLFEYVE
ncbi:nucleotidyltransferase domain-containing protein [bacterium]|nr:nucleotidyltransferase domain-containing protein [candidate division CSSED10-310 bacterium]